MPRSFLSKEKPVLVVIDVQEKLLPRIMHSERVVNRITTAIGMAKIFNLPIIVTEQNPRGLGSTVPEIESALPIYNPISKTEFSCLRSSAFRSQIENLNRKTLVLVGIETHICVQQTALDAINEGYSVFVLADAVSSANEMDHVIALDAMAREGVVISTVQSLMYEMLRSSSASEFRDVLSLVKSEKREEGVRLDDFFRPGR